MANPSAPPGKSEKYARPERERMWLLSALPALAESTRQVEITDHYFVGTRLRLRRAEDRSGAEPTVYKLTQKVLGEGGGPMLTTNTYLSKDEYDLLRPLGGDVVEKTRYRVPPLGVDVFGPPLDGLVLAEVEFDTDEELLAFEAPSTAFVEVTDDERFTGARLARTTREQLGAYLAEYGVNTPL